jgi:hypothetical protein
MPTIQLQKSKIYKLAHSFKRANTAIANNSRHCCKQRAIVVVLGTWERNL